MPNEQTWRAVSSSCTAASQHVQPLDGETWLLSLETWIWQGDQCLTTPCHLVWDRVSVSINSQTGKILDSHRETFLSELPCRWVWEPNWHGRRGSERLETKNLYLKSPENHSRLQWSLWLLAGFTHKRMFIHDANRQVNIVLRNAGVFVDNWMVLIEDK